MKFCVWSSASISLQAYECDNEEDTCLRQKELMYWSSMCYWVPANTINFVTIIFVMIYKLKSLKKNTVECILYVYIYSYLLGNVTGIAKVRS